MSHKYQSCHAGQPAGRERGGGIWTALITLSMHIVRSGCCTARPSTIAICPIDKRILQRRASRGKGVSEVTRLNLLLAFSKVTPAAPALLTQISSLLVKQRSCRCADEVRQGGAQQGSCKRAGMKSLPSFGCHPTARAPRHAIASLPPRSN